MPLFREAHFSPASVRSRYRYDDRDPLSRQFAFYAFTYYPGATDEQSALPVDVGIGADLRGIDIRLIKFVRQASPLYHVKGTVTGVPPGLEGYVSISGKNVFIAECKVWHGEKELLDAIDQVLSYMNWRDTKAAIPIFNRNANFTSVLAQRCRILRPGSHSIEPSK